METNNTVTAALAADNRPGYNISKCLEEMFELGEKLTKFLNKKEEYKPKTPEITEEIGDLYVRLAVVARQFGDEAVQERINYKSGKLLSSIEKGMYKGGV